MNQPCDRRAKRFAVAFLIFCAAAATSFGQTAAVTVQINGDGTVSPNYNGQQLVIGKSYTMTAKATDGFTFTGWTGSQPDGKSKLKFTMAANLVFTANFADRQKPTLSATAPPGSKALTSDTVIVTGTARDNASVAGVFWQLSGVDGTNWFPASTGNRWSNWWATVTLNANANTLLAYAVDGSGNQSKTAKVNMTLITVPTSLDGLTMAATSDGINTNTKSFNAGTFSEDTAVGSYTFKTASASTAKLSLTYAAPPTAAHASNDVTLLLRFTDNTNGSFTDGDGANTFTLSQAENVAPDSLAEGTTINITNSGGDGADFVFPADSQIVDNGSMFNVSNPLVVSLASPYAGQIGDRVGVAFTHLKDYFGQWLQVGTPTYYGTVIDIPTNADTVTILFDTSSFISKDQLYAPVTGDFVNIVTFSYTNYSGGAVVTNGTGTFTFTPYGPDGALLQLEQPDENEFLVLTFIGGADSGTYYRESYEISSNTPALDSGVFGLTLPPQITVQPQDSILATNGGTNSFSVTAIGSPTLAYQWQENGTNLTDGSTTWGSVISGSTTTNLTLADVSTNDVGNYQVVVTNDFGSATSRVAQLTTTSSTPSP
jgi:uncharacterized repeat protein (TIGR02543 family)